MSKHNEEGTPKAEEKKGAGEILLEELTPDTPKKGSWVRNAAQSMVVPLLAVLTGLIFSGIFIFLTTTEVYQTWAQSPLLATQYGIKAIFQAYGALLNGSLGNPGKILASLQSGDPAAIRNAFYPLSESLVTSTPYIFAGLAVALGFRAGLFNIGAEGQIFVGAICSAFVGYSFTNLPAIIHLPLALLAGMAGGAAWGFVPGWLKAKTGGHEVINTIMMNYIAFRLSDWLLSGPMQRPNSFNPISPNIQASAELPRLFGAPLRFHLGFFLALITAYGVYWLLFRTTWGFDLRTVGLNPNAARYAGMKASLVTMVAMSLSGALAGLAGANDVLGVNHNLAMAFSSGTGFTSIALALLGKSHPVGVVLASLLFGFLQAGATQMQLAASVPVDIIGILQGVILMFIAAPAIIRTIYRLRPPKEEEEGGVTISWGGA